MRRAAHFVNHVFEGFKFTGTGGHGNLFTTAQQVNQLYEDYIKLSLFCRELPLRPACGGCNRGGLPPQISTTMSKPRFVLVIVVGDVGSEIGQVSVGLAQYAGPLSSPSSVDLEPEWRRPVRKPCRVL